VQPDHQPADAHRLGAAAAPLVLGEAHFHARYGGRGVVGQLVEAPDRPPLVEKLPRVGKGDLGHLGDEPAGLGGAGRALLRQAPLRFDDE
jgi:hypothetical protein